MNEEAFLQKREDGWARLAILCERADNSPSALTAEELQEFIRLYRGVSRDLALVRTQSNNAPLIDYLNDLAGRAYGVLYRAPRKPVGQVIVGAVERAAQAFRRRFAFVVVSFTLFVSAAAITPVIIRQVPDTKEFIIPPMMKESFEGWKTGKHEERSSDESFLASTFYASNNPRQAVLTGSVGAGTFGIGSVFLVVFNGAVIGALANELAPVGRLPYLFSNIAPHGVPEMSGLFISGAAGLLFGWALIFPGRFSRGDSLREVGPDALTLLATSVIMMFIAAPIEGFFSFDPNIPDVAKAAVGLVEVVIWSLFWSQFGKGSESNAVNDSSPALPPVA